jgi:ADP-heptose:LPS heptosyltransferase
VTARGRHFASRVSESLLNAMSLPELVGSDADDMVRIARRIGTDAAYRTALREKVSANRLVSPLFDTARFTRDFEAAIRMMVERHRSGQAHEHMDVPDQGPVADRPAPVSLGRVAGLQATYSGCPLCNAPSTPLGFASSTGQARWHEPLPPVMEWMRCSACGHTHTHHYWTKAGRNEILAGGGAAQQDHSATPAERRALRWGPVVERAARALGGFGKLLSRASRPVWVDVGCGDGTLVMAAGDHGFAFVGIDIDGEATTRMQAQGASAVHQDFMELPFEIAPDVLSMMDVLAAMPDAAGAIRKAAKVLPAGGLLILSTADLSSSAWRALEATKTNPYWADLNLHHVFARDRLLALLRENGFAIVDFAIPGHSPAQMEIYAVRKELTAIENLRTADAICVARLGGLGDVLMAMGAAKALKTLSGRPIILETAAPFAGLARSCPHIDHVVANVAEVADRYPNIRHANLNPVSFGISPKHQIDAYLEAFGVSADARIKDIELAPDPPAEAQVESRLASWPTKPHERFRILLHAGQGDANRSWPMKNWEELASALIALRHQVIVIGSNADPRRPALIPTVGGILSAVDTLSAAATVALMRRSDILISADSGPIQLAGATDIGIVGLYSAVSGSCRLPFRHGVAGWRAAAVGPSCSFHPCYHQMHDGTVMAPFMEKLQNGSLSASALFANWCPDGGSFACMKKQITAAMVIEALGRLEPGILQHLRV